MIDDQARKIRHLEKEARKLQSKLALSEQARVRLEYHLDKQSSLFKTNILELTSTLDILERQIIERKQVEAQLAKSLSLLQATLESAHDAILVVDMDSNWTLYNQQFVDLWQITEELVDARDDEAALAYVLNQLEDADGFLNRVRELYATPEAGSFDTINFRDGRIIERHSIPQYIDGSVVGRVWSFRDVTEHKHAESELQKAKEKAESATRLKDQFIALLSHDLRSPLISIKGMLDLARTESPEGLARMGRKYIFDRMAQSVGGLITLTERLLDYGRLQTGAIKPEARFFNVAALVDEQIVRVSHLATVKKITIRNTLSESMHVYADPDLYGVVIHNLLSNAIKFTRQQGEISIFATDDLSVVIRDNGVGIDEGMVHNLFDSNARTSSLGTCGEKGTGIGLPYSYGIMKAHGGNLNAVRLPGAGTEFHVTLPRHDAVILVVDDQDAQRAIMKDMIAKLDGVQAVEARDGVEALEALEHIMPAVIITDIQMPRMNGFELVRQVRRMPQFEMVPIMAVTAFVDTGSSELREKFSVLGASDFFTKPLAEDEFLPVVARYLNGQINSCP